ncbi:MAG: hypothetical protein ACI4RG_02930, partial [Huintestinicola sp.]
MKKILRSISAVITAAALICGCTQVTDELPDSYYETDIISETETSPMTSFTEQTVFTVPETSSITSETFISKAETSDSSEIPTESETVTSSETETAAPTVTVTETETSSVTVSEAEFIPGTIPPETTAATLPSVTVITIPTISEAAESTSAESIARETEAYYPQNGYYPLNFDRQKAVWVSYLEYDRIMRGADEAEFTNALNACFDNIVALGCNTVYFQTRVYGDAYYNSSLFPKGDRLTGDYDPPEIAVRSAHDRGLSI